jgi:hypothetical protein
VRVDRLLQYDTELFLDLKGLANLHFDFELGEPFKPFEQLMGIMPEASRDQIPLAYRVCSVSFSSVSFRLLSIKPCRTSCMMSTLQ